MSVSNQTNGTEDLGPQATEAVRSIKESATGAVEAEKKKGAEQLAGVAGAVHSAADELEKQLPAAADYVHDAAARIDRVAASLRDRNLSDLLEDVRRLAHDQPVAFFGGALVAGFAISRFFKSAQAPAQQYPQEEI
jgi:ABC-type transporter Mla subunit MlaD